MSKRRRRRYKVDPITGIKYEKGSLMDVMEEWEKDLRKESKTPSQKYGKKRSKSSYYEPEFGFSDLPPWAQILVLLIIVGAVVWIFVIPPLVEWIHRHMTAIITVSIILLASIITGLALFWHYSKKWETDKEAERLAFEEEQQKRGFFKFIDRFGNEKWGTPEELQKWRVKDEAEREKEKLINRVISELEEFKPARKQLGLEYNYQLNLHGWLSKTFPSARIEKQRGKSRPDIVIDNVAIEVKGPTKHRDLVTIADKCMRYSKHFPDGIIIVLFEVEVNDELYSEWLGSLKEQYPQVEVIRKD